MIKPRTKAGSSLSSRDFIRSETRSRMDKGWWKKNQGSDGVKMEGSG